MFLHCRGDGAHQDLLNLLEQYRDCWTEGAVVHSFDGNEQEMHDFIAQGLYIGLNGWYNLFLVAYLI